MNVRRQTHTHTDCQKGTAWRQNSSAAPHGASCIIQTLITKARVTEETPKGKRTWAFLITWQLKLLSFFLSFRGGSWREMVRKHVDICSLVFPCSWRKPQQCRTYYEGKPTILRQAADHLGSAAEKQNPAQQSNSFVNTAPGLWFPEG